MVVRIHFVVSLATKDLFSPGKKISTQLLTCTQKCQSSVDLSNPHPERCMCTRKSLASQSMNTRGKTRESGTFHTRACQGNQPRLNRKQRSAQWTCERKATRKPKSRMPSTSTDIVYSDYWVFDNPIDAARSHSGYGAQYFAGATIIVQ